MFTTGSKLLIGSAFAAGVFAFVYGVTQGGALGTIGLISAAVGLALLAGINAYVRDTNVSAMDHEAFASSAAAQATARPSLWPLARRSRRDVDHARPRHLSGLLRHRLHPRRSPAASSGSSRAGASGPPPTRGYNADARNFLIDPLELPVAGAIMFGVVVYSFSRVMLGLPSKSATVVAFSIVAALVVGLGALVGLKRGASKAALTGTFGLAAVALVAGGTIAGLNGEREIEEHHTTGYIAEQGECGAEETEADEHASQTVAGKSNVGRRGHLRRVRPPVRVPRLRAGPRRRRPAHAAALEPEQRHVPQRVRRPRPASSSTCTRVSTTRAPPPAPSASARRSSRRTACSS